MGIIGCMSKGCKSLKSKLRLPSEKFAYGVFHMYYKENGLSTLIDGDIKDYLINTKSDIIKISYLTYIFELSVNVYKESENEEIYPLMISAIKKIEEGYKVIEELNIRDKDCVTAIVNVFELEKTINDLDAKT